MTSRIAQFVIEVREEVAHLNAQAAAALGGQMHPDDILANEVGQHVASKAAARLSGALERFDGKQADKEGGSPEASPRCTSCGWTPDEIPAQCPECLGPISAPATPSETEKLKDWLRGEEAREIVARAPFDRAGSDDYWDTLDGGGKEGPYEDADAILGALADALPEESHP